MKLGVSTFADTRSRDPGTRLREVLEEAELAELRVGLIVKELRQKNSLTQEELAKRIKTTKSAISRLENSTGGARLETLEKVAQAFGKELVIEFR